MTQFRWVRISTREKAKAFYESLLPEIRAAARVCGYAIGVHGSLLRDLDLIAVPWVENPSSKDTLARSIHIAAIGIESASYDWEQKPKGRLATCFPVCWTEWNEPNAGHIDLSVIGVE